MIILAGSISIRIPTDVANSVKELAKAEGKSQTQIVKDAINYMIDSQKATSPMSSSVILARVRDTGGSSKGITIPHRLLNEHGWDTGTELFVKFLPVENVLNTL